MSSISRKMEAAQSAQDFTSTNVCTRDEKKRPIAQALEGFKFSSPYGPEIKKWLRHRDRPAPRRICCPKYRVLTEQLAQRGLLKVICGTDTLGVGINVPNPHGALHAALQIQRAKKLASWRRGATFTKSADAQGGRAFDDCGVGGRAGRHLRHAIENLLARTKAGPEAERNS